MTANPYEEGSLQHEMWNNIHNKKVEKEKINYVESLKELIKIEKKSKQEAIFSEKYLRQLERRIEIFQAGESKAIKQEIEFLLKIYEGKDRALGWYDYREYVRNKIKELKSKIGEAAK